MSNDSIFPDSKRCTKCGEEKPLEMFSKNKNHKDGRAYQCKICARAQFADYYAVNRESLNEKSNAWKEAHPERTREGNARWRENNPERTRERTRLWREANADKVKNASKAYRIKHADRRNAQSREWRANNPERVKNRNAQWRQENGIEYQRKWRASNKHKLRAYRQASAENILNKNRRLRAQHPDRFRAYGQKRRARLAGVGGRGVTAADMQAMIYCQQGLCAYCERDGQKLTLDHIIPIDQNGPHDPDNCCMACGVCNSSKGNRTPEQWVDRWYLR